MNDEFEKGNQFADCIICAAGASRRIGEWKLSLPWFRSSQPSVDSGVYSGVTQLPVLPAGQPQESWLADAAVFSALAAGCRVILVAGFRGEELKKRFAGWPYVRVVRNEQWDQGMVSSIKAGLPYVKSPWFFVAHADMPLIGPQWYKTIFTHRPLEHCPKDAIAIRPIYLPPNQPGHPVLFSQAAIPLIQSASDGDSLKPVLHQCQVFSVDTEDQAVVFDVDTLESYISALAYLGKKSQQQVIQQTAAQDAAPTAAPEPAPQPAPGARPSSVRLITGSPGSGKTTQLRQNAFRSFINLMESPAFVFSLFIMVSQVQTGRKHDGRALGFDLEAFYWTKATGPSFFRQALCRSSELLHSADSPSLERGEPASSCDFKVSDPILLGPYLFDPGAFENLAHWLVPALKNHEPYQSIYVYVDEMGKLELDENRGLWPLFTQLMGFVEYIAAAGSPYELVLSVRKDRRERLAAYVADYKFNTTLFDLSEH
ncbi:NTP transferase domain-containing protein [Gracilinema caldarium]|uniref:NTP transferase domain-containing protein n=1 Tax=Gracilinema caldarium TaxID=215591 RepID=UPI0026EB611A|nr:NTP transferase domain-containing protein [Gracilinema caldarium]